MSSETVQPDVDERTVRALREYHSVIEEARGLFEVVSQSGNTYRVDLAEPACTCPDFQYRDDVTECKHIRRCRLETAQVDTEELEQALAERIAELQRKRADLEQAAQELAETEAQLTEAIDRLEEVAR